MIAFPSISAVFLLLLACHVAVSPLDAESPFPDPGLFIREVREAIRLDEELQAGFTYIERRRAIKLSKTGKLTLGPLRTFEVHPSPQPGRTYKRLIAIDGRPLDPAELARRDEEHRQNLRELAQRERAETSHERARRVREEADARRERNAILDDAVAVYAMTFVGRERRDGEPVIVVDITPRSNARVTTREGEWMTQLAGRIWVSEADYQIVRFDLHALDDISIGWGILGRVHEGSRFVFTRRKVEGVWLPAEVAFEASGRTLLFRKFRIQTLTTYSDYRRIRKPPAAIF